MEIISNIIKNKKHIIKKDILEYIHFVKSSKLKIKKNNIFYIDSKKSWDNFIQLFNIYNIANNLWWIYFLTKNIDNIYFLYKNIIDNFKLPKILEKELSNNIKSFDNNNKLNVFKDIKSISYLLIKEWFFKKEDFSEKFLYDDFDNITNIKNITLFFREVTTIFDRTTYEMDEAIFRLKRDYQKEIYNFILEKNINFLEKENNKIDYQLMYIDFLDIFTEKVLKKYVYDYIYYLNFFKKIHYIDIISYINSFLLYFENNILEDYYIISDDNNSVIIDFLTNNLIKILKENLKNQKNYFIKKEYSNDKIKDLFYYHIYY